MFGRLPLVSQLADLWEKEINKRNGGKVDTDQNILRCCRYLIEIQKNNRIIKDERIHRKLKNVIVIVVQIMFVSLLSLIWFPWPVFATALGTLCIILAVFLAWAHKLSWRINAYDVRCDRVRSFFDVVSSILEIQGSETWRSVRHIEYHIDELCLEIATIENNDIKDNPRYPVNRMRRDVRYLVSQLQNFGVTDGNLQPWFDRAKNKLEEMNQLKSELPPAM